MHDRIYMDNHASTPTDPRVVEAMLPYFTERFGNAASQHLYGWEAQEAVERAAHEVAALLGVDAKEIVFTSGATESNNLAVWGAMEAARARGRHFVTTAIEHPSVLEVAAQLQEQGCEVTYVPADRSGVVDSAAVTAALRADTVLCSVMWANNEIGTLQPVEAIAAACRERGVLFHTDAVQAAGKVPIAAAARELDLISISGHKMCGPKGIGALSVRRRRPKVHLAPRTFGGGQQRGLRAGTLPVPLIVGLGEACTLCARELDAEAARVGGLRDRLWSQLSVSLDGVRLNGDLKRRLPGNLNVSFAGVEAEALLLELKWIALSSGSACASAEHKPSHVLLAIGLSAEEAHSSMRFGLGRFTTAQEVERVADAVVQTVTRMRETSPLAGRVVRS
jgi:cysteine desulfurase